MKIDIAGRRDLEILINRFYDKVKVDPLIGHFFSQVNWEKHLPVMYDFWENVAFYTGSYTGNPLQIHQTLHKKNPLNADHFKQWQNLFLTSVDDLYKGEKAELVKQRAVSISAIIQIKILAYSTKC